MSKIDTAAERAKLAALEGHTPGPWETFFGEAYRVRADGMNIATAHFVTLLDRIPTKQVAANTCLISAAPDLKDTLAAALDEIDAERARTEKAEAGRDEWKDEYQTAARLLNRYREAAANRQAERDQALARLAVAYEAAASVCSTEAETRAKQAAERGHGEMQINRWIAGKVQATVLADKIRALTPAAAYVALDKMLAEARLEGWRAGRDAAAHACDWGDIYGDNAVRAIRALPEPKENNHD